MFYTYILDTLVYEKNKVVHQKIKLYTRRFWYMGVSEKFSLKMPSRICDLTSNVLVLWLQFPTLYPGK